MSTSTTAADTTSVGSDSTPEQLEATLAAAHAAAPAMAASGPDQRARWLRAVADALDAAADGLVPVAMDESGLPEPRLRGEVARSSGQLRMFADALDEGSVLDVIIDTADPDATPVPRPDLRRMLVPLGPVLVFAAGNFPFAFSVCGGDTASALAAGCPVVVKAHPGHPRLSVLTAKLMSGALREAGAPDGALDVVFGVETGVAALRDHRVKASGFTGSVAAGKSLHEVAANRDEPIPFYGELGSLNPVFVLPAAVEARGSAIADGYVASFTLGVGQFCTKPGLLFLPAGHGLRDRLTAAAGGVPAATMLGERIHGAFTDGVARLRKRAGLREWVRGTEDGTRASATLLQTTVPELLEDAEVVLEECFGPTSIVVEYADQDELVAAASAFGGNLTATIHAEQQDTQEVAALLAVVQERAGRVVWNGWPTGVAVTWAMQHGGPFPATVGTIHSSVGVTAVRRFQRPVSFQDTPQRHLPTVLRDANDLGISRRVDGSVTRDDVPTAEEAR
ncbi:MAG: aldehyde dehydrogenase (NADP(+)) [Nocardioidaceae bacterium]